MPLPREQFGSVDGIPVFLYTLGDEQLTARITNYGGIIVSLIAPDRHGKPGDVVLGFDGLEQYLENSPYFGALIGRYANRVANGRFELNGREYLLPKNDGKNTLHGGPKGFSNRVWQPQETRDSLVLAYQSKDGEEGFPGNLQIRAEYSVRAGELTIEYSAETDRATVINLTNHSYFNLAAEGSGTILDHELLINADAFTPTTQNQIPTGAISSVAGTPFDFRQATNIGARIDSEDEQLRFGKGYDHNWVLNREGSGLARAAVATDRKSGRSLEIHTTEPGLQVYSGNLLDNLAGKNGHRYPPRSGFSLETQHFPNSPNSPQFPSTLLNPGERFRSMTVYRFTVTK
jgi:aldose 1-epimerase